MKWKIIKTFTSEKTRVFSLADLYRAFPDKDPTCLQRFLAEMLREGMLIRISRGIYHILPLSCDPQNYVPEGQQLASYVMLAKEHYLAYASAMQVHGLCRKATGREYVVSKSGRSATVQRIAGVSVRFVRQDESRFFGYGSRWINQLEKAVISDLEKTLVDISTKPQYSGGITEVAFALYNSSSRIDHERLFYYFARNASKAAMKRYLYLTELLGMSWTPEHERMMSGLGSGISLLDPGEPSGGRSVWRFRLRINVDPGQIKRSVFTTT